MKTTKTAGGHRRISLDSVCSFLGNQDRVLENPEILVLPAATGAGERVVAPARKRLQESIQVGDEAVCRRIVLDLHAAGHPLTEICDNVIARVFHEIGDLWECGTVEIYQERHACEVAAKIMRDLDAVVAPARSGTPLAIGGSASGDHYTIASSMVEVVLRSRGWRVQRLGGSLPFESLSKSIRERKLRLFWLSVSFLEDVDKFIEPYSEFYENRPPSTTVVIGGKAITPDVRTRISFSSYCDNMRQLVDFANAISTPNRISATNDRVARNLKSV